MVEDLKVATAYGEGGAEAASMTEAAKGGEPGPADAGAKVVPDEAGPVGQGSTETDVKANIADAAARAAAKGPA